MDTRSGVGGCIVYALGIVDLIPLRSAQFHRYGCCSLNGAVSENILRSSDIKAGPFYFKQTTAR